MQSRKLAILLSALMICSGAAWAQQKPCSHGANESAEETQRKVQAISAVRLINTVQASYHNQNNRYATLEELAGSSWIESLKNRPAPLGDLAKSMSLNPKGEIIPGFEVRLTTDGTKYSIFVTDKTDSCGFSFFSDQQGVIYFGQAIGTSITESAKK